jgi:hypothetical protein
MTNYNNNFTATQQAFLTVTPQVMSTLSLLGSAWILVEIWICSNKRYFVYHKLVSTMALYSLVASLGYYLDSDDGDYDDTTFINNSNSNTTTTCIAQAILLQFHLGTSLYFGILGVYYMLVISYSISEEKLQDQYIETIFHLIPFLAVTGTAIAGPLMGTAFAPQTPLPWCWLDQENVAATWGLYLGPAWLSLAVFVGTLVVVFRGVQAQEQRMKRYILTGNPTASADHSNHSIHNGMESADEGGGDGSSSFHTADGDFPAILSSSSQDTRNSRGSRMSTLLRRKTQRISKNVHRRFHKITHFMEHLPRTRQVIGQAMWYVMASMICIVVTLGAIAGSDKKDDHYRFWIAASQVWLQPLQGWMNFLTYRRPTFLRFRRKGMNILQATVESFKFDCGALNGSSTHHNGHRRGTIRPRQRASHASGRRRSSISQVLLDLSDRARPLMTVNVTRWFDSSASTNDSGGAASTKTRRKGKKNGRRNSHPEPKNVTSNLFASSMTTDSNVLQECTNPASSSSSTTNSIMQFKTTADTASSARTLLELQTPRRHSEPPTKLLMASSDDEGSNSLDGNAYEQEDTVSSVDVDTSDGVVPTRITDHGGRSDPPMRQDSQSTMSTLRSSLATHGSSRKFEVFKDSNHDDDSTDSKNKVAVERLGNLRMLTKQKDKSNIGDSDCDADDLEEGGGGDLPMPLISRATMKRSNNPNHRTSERRRDRRMEMVSMQQHSQRFLDLVCMDVIPEADDAAANQWRDLMTGASNNHNGEDGSLRMGPAPRSPRRSPQGSPSNWSRMAKTIRANPLFQRSQRFTLQETRDKDVEENREEAAISSSVPPPPPPPPPTPPPPDAFERTQSDQAPPVPPMPVQTILSHAQSDQYQSSFPHHPLQSKPISSPDGRFWAKLAHRKNRKGVLGAIERQHGTPEHHTPSNREKRELDGDQPPAPRRTLSRSESNREIARKELDKKRAELLTSINDMKLSARQLQAVDDVSNSRGTEGPPPPMDSSPGQQRRKRPDGKRPPAPSFWSRFSNRNLGNIQEISENDESFASLHHSGLSSPRAMRYGNGSELFVNEGTKDPGASSNEISLLSLDSKKTIHRSNQRKGRVSDPASTSDLHQRSSELSSHDGDAFLNTVEDEDDDDDDPLSKILTFESSGELNMPVDIAADRV